MSTKIAPSSWLASVALHAGAFAWLIVGAFPASLEATPRTIEMIIAPSEPAPPLAPAKAEPEPTGREPASAPKAEPRRAPAPTRPEQPQQAAPSTPAPDEPALDLTGTTLTSERGSFASRVGNGAPMTGAIGAGGGGPATKTSGVAVATAGRGPLELTPKEDLARLPAPPDLTDRLLAMYPARAKTLGDTGQATLSLVVLPDGQIGTIDVRSASSTEFAKACKDTVAGSRWAPPLDRNGKAVATRVGYTCRFDVR